MTTISDLPKDLLEEVISKVPLQSIKAMRSTCKTWNSLFKDESLTKKLFGKSITTKANEFQVVMMVDFKIYLMGVKFHGIHNNTDPFIKPRGKLVSLDDEIQLQISQVFHCDGLLLCITGDKKSRLVFWNPYYGQTKLIKPRNCYHFRDRYALGYEKKNNLLHSHKILRFIDDYEGSVNHRICEFEMYSFKSNSWKVVDVNLDWYIMYFHRGVSLKGNTYWFAREKFPIKGEKTLAFLLCFDFTTESFGPRLPLPTHSYLYNTVGLSSVGEKNLAMLCQICDRYRMEIWISSTIEPNAVSWNKLFLAVDMEPLTRFRFLNNGGSFFVDEKKKVAVILSQEKDTANPTQNIAYIIGEKGYLKQVDLGKITYKYCYPLACFYVPSSVQIKQSCTM